MAQEEVIKYLEKKKNHSADIYELERNINIARRNIQRALNKLLAQNEIRIVPIPVDDDNKIKFRIYFLNNSKKK